MNSHLKYIVYEKLPIPKNDDPIFPGYKMVTSAYEYTETISYNMNSKESARNFARRLSEIIGREVMVVEIQTTFDTKFTKGNQINKT